MDEDLKTPTLEEVLQKEDSFFQAIEDQCEGNLGTGEALLNLNEHVPHRWERGIMILLTKIYTSLDSMHDELEAIRKLGERR